MCRFLIYCIEERLKRKFSPSPCRRMEAQDQMSQASSVVTISTFPIRNKDGDDRVQSFGKGCRAVKRDPNCPVVIRGWLNKKDSCGLKLWKRRWFVLSNYCLFYYKDSREESVLGSIPLPSYSILFCTPRECKHRKNTFKVVHQGMRSYFFSADTQEDMLSWVRALNQSACMEADGSVNRRCSSYQDFTQIGGSSESVDFTQSHSLQDGLCQNAEQAVRSQREPSLATRGRTGTPHSEPRGRRSMRQSPLPKTPSPREFRSRRAERTDEDSHPFLSSPNTPPEFTWTGSLTPRGQLVSRPHTPVGRVDIRPQGDPGVMSQFYASGSPELDFQSAPHTPGSERWQTVNRPTPVYSSLHHIPSGRRALGKINSTDGQTDLLPPLPPTSRVPVAPHPSHSQHHRSHMSVCLPSSPVSAKSELKDNETPFPIRFLESEADAVLTRLCGCDKLLQSLSLELAQLQLDKDHVQYALEMTRMQLDEWRSQGLRGQEEAVNQKVLLQEELVTIRARMCDVSVEMERVWSQYERMESEISVFRSHLQHVCNFGMPEEQSQAQRELWMMEDILSGLRVNRDHFRVLLGLQKSPGIFQKSSPRPGTPGSPTERMQCCQSMGVESEPPARPPLPQEDTNQGRDPGHGWMDPNNVVIYTGPVDPLDGRGNSQSHPHGDRTQRETAAAESQFSSRWSTTDLRNKKGRMSEEEQMERMRRHEERMTSQRNPLSSPVRNQGQSSQPIDEVPFPLRVTRIVTAFLPSPLIARHVSVEDPPPELATPLPEQIPLRAQHRLTEPSAKMLQKPPRKQLFDTSDRNSAKQLANALQGPASEGEEQHAKSLNATGVKQSHNVTTRTSDNTRAERPNSEPSEDAGMLQSVRHQAVVGNEGVACSWGVARDSRVGGGVALPDPDLFLTPDQREAKLRRVERIRERVVRSAVRESAVASGRPLSNGEQDGARSPSTKTNESTAVGRELSVFRPNEDVCGGWCHEDGAVLRRYTTEEHPNPGEKLPNAEGEKGNMKGHESHFENRIQLEGRRDRKGVMKHKKQKKPPISSNHISSLTVYQSNEGQIFEKRCEEEQQQNREELLASHGEHIFPSTNERAEWFLSTNHRSEFIPLCDQGMGSTCREETLNLINETTSDDAGTALNCASFSFGESLEKMLQNHSLFYKITSDINLSDTDIAMTDGHSGEEMVGATDKMSTADEVTYDLVPHIWVPHDDRVISTGAVKTKPVRGRPSQLHSSLPGPSLSSPSANPSVQLQFGFL
ncbi:hypothetical protein DPEC_G00356020 [Dallia pectoralis]|uniref:Uncharacterized protein n=1 Tax=Dallia pectoralis TaxID=75939 RepID=A0ACC2EZQ2_DALPE|nr:hypothetical protein DPEC_G00356020 [Dallia pectoralis]